MKNRRPIIGIVARPENIDDTNFLVVVDSYGDAVIQSGGNPLVLLPPHIKGFGTIKPKDMENLTDNQKQMIVDQINLCDGILMPGGNKRYEFDRFITNYCINNDIPVLGVCLGMQLLATHINRDTLELTDNNLSHSKPGIDKVHTVRLDKNSKLYNIIGEEEFCVNSRHKFKVTETGELSVVGYSGDGVIEAIEHKDKKFVIGVQWHPENLMNTLPSQKLFNAFIESCKR